MRPVCWSQPHAEDIVVVAGEPEGSVPPAPLEWAPEESPGVFVEQPFERWLPRDLVIGVARLVRSTGEAIVRGVATS